MRTDERMAASGIEPVVKEVNVPLPAERAFALFTEGIAGWWPLRTHSVEREKAIGCFFEPYVGGRLVEAGPDGREHVLGHPAGLGTTVAAGADMASRALGPDGAGSEHHLRFDR